jgi:hypothetical protein
MARKSKIIKDPKAREEISVIPTAPIWIGARSAST